MKYSSPFRRHAETSSPSPPRTVSISGSSPVSPLPSPRVQVQDDEISTCPASASLMLPVLRDGNPSLKTRSRADTASTEVTSVLRDDDDDDVSFATNHDSNNHSAWDDQELVVQLAARFGYTTEHDLAKLWELRGRLADINHMINHPAEILRHLLDARGNVDACEERVRNMLAWRLVNHIDDLLQENFDIPRLFLEYDPHTFLQGTDKDGDPIWIDRTGVSDAWALYQKYGHETFCKYTLWVRERALRGDFAKRFQAEHNGRPVTQVTAIFDMDGLCRRHLQIGLAPMLEEGIRILQDYYSVSMCKRIIVIRAPIIFRIVWNIVQHFCSDQLKKTIVFASRSQYLKVLDQYVDREVLPSCICPEGKGRPALGMPQSLVGGIMTAEEMVAPKENFGGCQSLKPQSSYETIASDDDTYSFGTSNKDSGTMFGHPTLLVSPPTSPVRVKSLVAGYFDDYGGQVKSY